MIPLPLLPLSNILMCMRVQRRLATPLLSPNDSCSLLSNKCLCVQRRLVGTIPSSLLPIMCTEGPNDPFPPLSNILMLYVCAEEAGGGGSTPSGGSLASVLPGLSSLSSMVHPSEAMDMPVDPNEPTYCLCHQVSYGEMIACDRTDVSRVHSGIDTYRSNCLFFY